MLYEVNAVTNSAPSPTLSPPVWRKWLFLLALALILLGLNLAYNAIEAYRPALSGQPGDVLYAAGFDGFSDEWQQYSGRLSAQIADGKLTIQVDDAPRAAYSLSQAIFFDFDVRVVAEAVAGPIDNGYGLVFRLQKADASCNLPFKILCDAANLPVLNVVLPLLFRPSESDATGYYLFLVSSDGYYSVWRAEETNNSTQARKISTWIQSGMVRQGLNNPNTLRVIGRGDTFQFFINGQRVNLCIPNDPTAESTYNNNSDECVGGTMQESLTDSQFSVGQIGVIAQTTQTGGLGVSVHFDNLLITQPDQEGQG